MHKGFTLIEVLIALLVLAIGLVGIAALHLNGLRNAHSSYFTSIASSVALDFEERLWIAMADINEGCLAQGDVDAVLGAVQSNWISAGEGFVSIPGLTVERTDDVRVDSEGIWLEVDIAVGWTDERFAQSNESFSYRARVVCAPVLAP